MAFTAPHFWQHRRGRLEQLDEAECLSLLTGRQVGRVGFTTPRGPRIVPMNYVVADDAIWLTTAAGSEIAEHGLTQPTVAFEVDELDDFLQAGWSVLAVGPIELHQGTKSPLSFEDRPDPWAEGREDRLLRLRWIQLSGRRLYPS